jgi:hypothetical protein
MRDKRCWFLAAIVGVGLVGCGRLGFDDRSSQPGAPGAPGEPGTATFSPVGEAPDATMFAAPSTTGLEAYWSFDEADAVAAEDVNGTGNTAACRDTSMCPGRATGVIGNAATFGGGSDQCFTVPTMQTWAAPAFTVGAWVTTPTMTGSIFVHESESGCPSPELRLGSGVAGLVQLNTTGSTHNNAFTPAMAVPAGQWHHLAVTWDGTTQEVFVDGACNCSITPTKLPLDNPQELTIGCYPDSGEVFSGAIDDLRVYNRVLAPEEIGALYSFGSHLAPAAHGCTQTCANVAPPL